MQMTSDPKKRDDSRPVRQFRVVVTESPFKPSLSVLLSWRTFPCIATHWDGVAAAEVPWDGSPITSQEALREALSSLAAEDWTMGPVVRR